MNKLAVDKVQMVRIIVKAYFFAALAGSFAHIVDAAHMTGLSGWEAWSTPFMIDGLAIIGMVMRSADFSRGTNKTGLKVQLVMGCLSLIANVYAAKSMGGVIYGVGIVLLFLTAEWLGERLESKSVDIENDAKVKRSEAAKKAVATRKRNAKLSK